MNRDTIYVIITTHLIVHRHMNYLFTEALTPHKLEVTSGRRPGLPTFVGDAYSPETLRFNISEHVMQSPLRMEPEHPQRPLRIMPAISDTPMQGQINIAVVGATHSGKTAIIRALEAALIADGVPGTNIQRYSLDYPHKDPELPAEQLHECLANMLTRKVVILFQGPKRMTDVAALMERCGHKNTVPQQS